MKSPKPNRYIINGVDGDGTPTPVAYRVVRRRPDDHEPAQISVHLPDHLHRQVQLLRESGDDIFVEPLMEMPDELLETWMSLRLCRLVPAGHQTTFNDLVSLALERADKLRNGMLAERTGEQLFVAVHPQDSNEVIDLVFTRGKPAIYSRRQGEWVRSSGAEDFEYGHCQMLKVDERVLDLYDERTANARPLSLSELRMENLLAEDPHQQSDC